MTIPAKLECRTCGLNARVLRSGVFAAHYYQQSGTKHTCENSGQPAPIHGGSFRIVQRDPNVWLCECACGETFLGPEYDDVETPWAKHCAEARAA